MNIKGMSVEKLKQLASEIQTEILNKEEPDEFPEEVWNDLVEDFNKLVGENDKGQVDVEVRVLVNCQCSLMFDLASDKMLVTGLDVLEIDTPNVDDIAGKDLEKNANYKKMKSTIESKSPVFVKKLKSVCKKYNQDVGDVFQELIDNLY